MRGRWHRRGLEGRFAGRFGTGGWRHPRPRRRRLHLQIFRALVATGFMSLLLTALAAWLFRGEGQRMPRFVQDVGAFVLADMPEHDPVAFQRELKKRAARLHASLSVWGADGKLVAQEGESLGPRTLSAHSLYRHDQMRLRLDDGRTLGLSFNDKTERHNLGMMFCSVALLLGTLMLGSWLAARRITRRLERLEYGVTQFGEGKLDVRVHIRGRDEIASLAHAFNRSCDRITGLLKQQRSMLQSASHELRSPLARLRMAFELALEPGASPAERERLGSDASRDIEELDALIGDLLLAGRLADTELPKDFVEVPLGPIVESEAARVSAQVQSSALVLEGNARMLRSLVRNLLENARRYGRDPIKASLTQEGGCAVLCVEDAGDGVPLDDRERIFEPFYRPVGHREGKDGGVGLGLSLVKNIADHHGGSVRYLPANPGSCFEVRIPLKAPSARPAPR